MELIVSIKHKKIVAFVLGILASLSFAPVYALPLLILSLILMWLIADTAGSYKKNALLGYIYGVGFFGAGFYWISNALLISGFKLSFLYPFTLLALGVFFGLFWIIPFLCWHFFRNDGVWAKILAFCASFVIMEYLRSFILTGFPWNMLGTIFAFHPLMIQLASVGGTYILSFIALILCGSLYAVSKGEAKSGIFIFASTIFLLISFGYIRLSSYTDISSQTKIRLVQPSITQDLKWDPNVMEQNLDTYIKMSQNQDLNTVKFVLCGEPATPFDPNQSQYIKDKIKKAVPENGYLITGLIRYDSQTDKAYNSLSIINDKGQTVAFYDKHHLVPFGEYLPLAQFLPDFASPITNIVSDLGKGEKLKNIELDHTFKFGALICYEIIFPDEVVNRQDKPSFLVVLSNDGWYGESFGPYQHLVSAQMRAVEEGITVVRSANNGISALINPLGKVTNTLLLNQKGIADVYLPLKPTVKTFYSIIGGKTIQYVMWLILLMLIAVKIMRLKLK